MRKVLLIVVVAVVFAGGSVMTAWYNYVTNTKSPYDELGITFNQKMPLPLRRWGCGKLKATFPNALPPLGCKSDGGTGGATGREWL